LIEALDDQIDDHLRIAQDCMNRASEIVLNGFRVTGDVRTLTYPARFLDADSQVFWDQVMELVARAKALVRNSENSDTNPSESLTPAHSYSSSILN
jgi:hypothetical protein